MKNQNGKKTNDEETVDPWPIIKVLVVLGIIALGVGLKILGEYGWLGILLGTIGIAIYAACYIGSALLVPDEDKKTTPSANR